MPSAQTLLRCLACLPLMIDAVWFFFPGLGADYNHRSAYPFANARSVTYLTGEQFLLSPQ